MSEFANCPDEQTLRDFAAGRLVGSDASALHAHLTACSPCGEKLAALRLRQTDPTQVDTANASSGFPHTQQFDMESDDRELDESRFDFKLLAPSHIDQAVGRLGKYDILSIEGYGGMGVVFKAFDEQLRRTVAIKVLNRTLASSATARRRFIREARAAAAINHPNVVTIHAVEEHESLPFLVMEFINGRSLRDRIRKEQRLEPIEVLRLGAQIAAGLAAAHAQGVVHRDIKPGNIMLEQGVDRVKITDFGLARAAIDNVELTSREVAVGTPAYMAPEQVGGGPVDPRADLFSLGCVMYSMASGQSPFHGTNALEMARRVADHTPSPLHELDPRVPPFLSDIVARLLEKSPNARYQSAAEVRRSGRAAEQAPYADQSMSVGSVGQPAPENAAGPRRAGAPADTFEETIAVGVDCGNSGCGVDRGRRSALPVCEGAVGAGRCDRSRPRSGRGLTVRLARIA